MWAQAIGSVIGAGLNFLSSKNQQEMQKEFAQKGIQWKVNDAKKAGIHPLAALGAQTTTYSPVSVGSDLSQVGQDIGRALQSKQEPEDKTSNTLQKLQIQRAELENTMLASQIARYNQAGQPPPMPSASGGAIAGQGDSGPAFVKREAQEALRVDPNHPGAEPGKVTDVAWSKNPDGSYSLLPSEEAKKRFEDMTLPQWQWSIRNQLVPDWHTEPHRPPPGMRWVRNPLTGRWWLEQAPGAGRFAPNRPFSWGQ